MRIPTVASLLSVVLSTTGLAATPEQIAVSLAPSGAVRVPARINGQGSFSFLLDTGSSHSTLSRELVDLLALPVVARARVSTPAGVQMQPVVRLEHISVGNAGVEGLMPSVVSLAELRELEPGVDGVIGQDFHSETRPENLSLLPGPAKAGPERLPTGPARLPSARARKVVTEAASAPAVRYERLQRGCRHPIVPIVRDRRLGQPGGIPWCDG